MLQRPISRRNFFGKLAAAAGLLGGGVYALSSFLRARNNIKGKIMPSGSNSKILQIRPLGFQWETADPFLFCVHHLDKYPEGNTALGPSASLAGRDIGQDFTVKNGWRMYHGEKVPGFPGHPHRGFETITVVRSGFVDHSDSMGAAGRYGSGDVQWMTAGAGVQHAEMFPLLDDKQGNTLELFQIWLNLPRASKFVKPHFKMLWRNQIPIVEIADTNGLKTRVEVIAGRYADTNAAAPPPDSWASGTDNAVAIWHIDMLPGSSWQLPAAETGLNRFLYFYEGQDASFDGSRVASGQGIRLAPDQDVEIINGSAPAKLLLLQGRPSLSLWSNTGRSS